MISGKPSVGRDMPKVTILLALRNGARYLRDQLESFAAQEGVDWRLVVADDGSTDSGPRIVAEFAASHAGTQIAMHPGPRAGLAANFLHLLNLAGPDVPHAALSDQDDVWLPEKLARATAQLGECAPGRPAIFCSRTVICDADLAPLGLSPRFTRPPSFRNALIQNIAGGNTMVLNRAALDLAQAASAEAGQVVVHDWWLYQLVTGAGGTVIYDDAPTLLYRQHGGNQIGANTSFQARLRRARMVAGGILRRWNDTNIAALRASAHRLTPENRALLEGFAESRSARLPRRMRNLSWLGLYRQTRGGNASYWCAAAAGLI
jgi:glycosyltransferase involved in cell wall biosynthesis